MQESVAAQIGLDSAVTHLEAAVRRGARVCAHGTLGDALLQGSAQPGPGRHWNPLVVQHAIVGRTGRGLLNYSSYGSLDAMDKGYCSAAVIETSQLHVVRATTGQDHCNKDIASGEASTSEVEPVDIALPVRSNLEPYVSYMIQRFQEDNTFSYQSLLASAIAETWPNDCNQLWQGEAAAEAGAVRAVDVNELGIFLMLSLICSVSGVILSRFGAFATTDYGEAGGCY